MLHATKSASKLCCLQQGAHLTCAASNKGKFCTNSEIDTPKAIICREQSETLSHENSKHLLRSIVYLQFSIKKVSLCSLHIIALKLVCQFWYYCQICFVAACSFVVNSSLSDICAVALFWYHPYSHTIPRPTLTTL